MEIQKYIKEFIEKAIKEDVCDYTTLSCVPHDKNAKAHLLVKQGGILAGVDYVSVEALTHQVKSLDLSLKTISK